jgi:hypothetical protein
MQRFLMSASHGRCLGKPFAENRSSFEPPSYWWHLPSGEETVQGQERHELDS